MSCSWVWLIVVRAPLAYNAVNNNKTERFLSGSALSEGQTKRRNEKRNLAAAESHLRILPPVALCWRRGLRFGRRMLALSLTTGFTPRFTLGRSSETISAGAEVATLPRYSPAVRRATIGCRAPQPVLSFDESAYEEDRLARDAEAMTAMAVEEAKAAEDAKFAVLRNPWKWVIRRHASQSSEHCEASTPLSL